LLGLCCFSAKNGVGGADDVGAAGIVGEEGGSAVSCGRWDRFWCCVRRWALGLGMVVGTTFGRWCVFVLPLEARLLVSGGGDCVAVGGKGGGELTAEERTRKSSGGECWVQRRAAYVVLVRLCWCLLFGVGGDCGGGGRTRRSSGLVGDVLP
jgi:hypothetical protein